MLFTIHSLPATYGDCIWIEYGTKDKLHRILIDGGTAGTKEPIKEMLNRLPQGSRHFDLVVVTHIDRDHIEGLLSLLNEETPGFTTDDFWFNGWSHLAQDGETDSFGPIQGDALSAALFRHGVPWNRYFNNKAIVIKDPAKPPVIQLAGGMEITLLSPLTTHLAKLKGVWQREVIKANLSAEVKSEVQMEEYIESLGAKAPDLESLVSAPFYEDDGEANGSSIAFLAKFNGKTALFTGDAFPSVILNTLTRIYGQEKVPIDLIKLSHHASAGNTSPELIKKLACSKFIVSTNGSIFKHPSANTVARVLKLAGREVSLYFNYISDHNKIWKSKTLRQQYGYKAIYPEKGEGITVQL
jgi:beta-lactamase superfamily II metal-dependent hydrolase